MANGVFANGREIACKAGSGKVIAAFPDVCFTPPDKVPPTPLGVPVPYPLTSMATDTNKGSKKVVISGKEVMKRDASNFKKCSGDDAAKTAKKGMINSKLTGKVQFASWSMDVKVEGKNVVRHLDMTTSNHASPMANAAVPWPYTDTMAAAFGKGGKCEGMEHIRLQEYKKPCPNNAQGEPQTGHHLIPGRCMRGTPGYNHKKAPVICVSRGNQHQGGHKRCHAKFDPVELDHYKKKKKFTYAKAKSTAASSAGGAMEPPRDLSKKEEACVSFQLDKYYRQPPPAGPGCKAGTGLRASGARGKVIPRAKASTKKL